MGKRIYIKNVLINSCCEFWGDILSIILTLLILCIIVILHEWGHFIVAKKSGVLVEEFAVGMGPKLFSVKRGETMYSLRLIPIGGYCKMADEVEEGSQKLGFNQVSLPLKE